MKNIIKEFLELFGYCVLVVCFLFTSYLLLSNLYHYRDISGYELRTLANETNYKQFKETVNDIKKNVNSVNLSNVNDSSKVSAALMIKDGINSCVTILESSYFYQLDQKNTIVTKDVYEANKEMYNTINNRCLFFIPYYVEASKDLYDYGDSFDELKDEIEFKKNKVFEYSNFLFSKSLGNSSYNHVTNITKTTIYNDLNHSINLTVSNYNELVNGVYDLSSWYVDEFGGAY